MSAYTKAMQQLTPDEKKKQEEEARKRRITNDYTAAQVAKTERRKRNMKRK